MFLVEADLDRVRGEWLRTNGQSQIKEIARHYGIFEHLFGYAYFTPRVPLNINVHNALLNKQKISLLFIWNILFFII